LTGHFVPEMMYLSHLEILNLDGNKIMGKIDSHVGNLTKLKEIDLDNNHLTGTIPEEMFKLANLRVLDLNDNYLSGTISSRIGELMRLEFVQLHNNDFTGTLPSSVGRLSNMSMLTLSGNSISGEIGEEVCALRQKNLDRLVADCASYDQRVNCPSDCCTHCFVRYDKLNKDKTP